MAAFMSIDPTASIWPTNAVACISDTQDPQSLALGQDNQRTIVIELDGATTQYEQEVSLLLGTRLAVPELILTQPAQLPRAIEKRLAIMAATERHVILALHHPEQLPLSVVGRILDLVKNTPLRLLLVKSHSADLHTLEQRIRTAGLTLQNLYALDPPETTKASSVSATAAPVVTGVEQEPKASRSNKFVITGVLICAFGALGWWKLTEPATIETTKSEPGTVIPQTIPQKDAPPAALSNEVAPTSVRPAPQPVIDPPSVPAKPQPVATRQLPKYTIQIASYASYGTMTAFLESLENKPEDLRQVTKADAPSTHVLVYGEYLGYTAALEALRSLPESLVFDQPFIIRVDGLKN